MRIEQSYIGSEGLISFRTTAGENISFFSPAARAKRWLEEERALIAITNALVAEGLPGITEAPPGKPHKLEVQGALMDALYELSAMPSFASLGEAAEIAFPAERPGVTPPLPREKRLANIFSRLRR